MKLVPLSDIFSVSRGSDLELNALIEEDGGVPFVSRTAENNGVSAHVTKLEDVPTLPANTLSVALGGTPLATFLQKRPYYTGFHVACLTPLAPLADPELLYYAACISANRYRYSYGRQANRTLKSLLVPARSEIPVWVAARNEGSLEVLAAGGLRSPIQEPLDTRGWRQFRLAELFDIRKGQRLTKDDMDPGTTAFVGATESNNGITARIGHPPLHPAGTITVSYNGSVGEAFYQPEPFWASDDVNVLYPRSPLCRDSALFMIALIRRERYRFNYGRKWRLETMKETRLRLPAAADGTPDFAMMANIVRACPAASVLHVLEHR